jgi:hypothetical protein
MMSRMRAVTAGGATVQPTRSPVAANAFEMPSTKIVYAADSARPAAASVAVLVAEGEHPVHLIPQEEQRTLAGVRAAFVFDDESRDARLRFAITVPVGLSGVQTAISRASERADESCPRWA